MRQDLAGRYLCFSLNRERFAVPLLKVKEVLGNIETTPIPQAPSHFKGIMNLRGTVISVVDLRTKMQIKTNNPSAESTIIIFDLDSISIGVVVDSVDCVRSYETKDISPPPDLKDNYITGVAKEENSLTLLIDIHSILNREDLKTLKSQSQKAA